MLEQEQEIVNSLTEKFAFLREECHVIRARRIFAKVPRERILEVITFAKDTLQFGMLCAITGLDVGDDYQLLYHLASDAGVVLSIRTSALKSDPVFETVTEFYNGAALYEIEACNLLGLRIKGVPEDIRYPLPDGWPDGQYPLRKDWNGQAPDSKPEGEC